MTWNDLKRQPPGKNETIFVGMDVWFLNQVDAVQQVFDANLFEGFTNMARLYNNDPLDLVTLSPLFVKPCLDNRSRMARFKIILE